MLAENQNYLRQPTYLVKTVMKILIIVFYTRVEIAYGVVLDLNDIIQVFYTEMKTNVSHDVIFCGNFNYVQVDYKFSKGYQFALQPENWIVESDGLNATAKTDGNSVILYVAPSTEESFFDIIEAIGSFFTEVNTTTIKSNRRIIFIAWPEEIDDETYYSTSSNTNNSGFTSNATLNDNMSNATITARKMLRRFQEDEYFTEIVKSIRQNEEVYILLWKKSQSINTMTNKNAQTLYGKTNYEIVDLIEVYGIVDTVPVIQSLIKDFDDNPNVDVVMEDINTTELMRFSARRKDFHKVRFRVVAQHDESYDAEVKVEEKNGTVRFVSGSSFRILKDFQFMLNFRYKAVSGAGWINEREDKKSLTGLGQQIIDKEADICISTSTLEAYRAKYVQFLQPTITEESFLFFRQPSVVSARNIFTMPFAWSLWWNVGGLWIILMFCSSFIVHQKHGNFRHVGTSRMFSKYKKESENFHSVDVFVWAIGVLCQQGWSTNPMKISTRVVFLTAMFTSVMVYAYYTAAFVAAISAPVIPIKSIDDMKKYQYQVFIDPSSPAILIAYVGEVEGRRITEISTKYFRNNTESIKSILMEDSKLASIIGVDAYFAEGLVSHTEAELCEIYQIKPNGSARVKDAMIVRRGSSYKEIFGHKIIFLMERGLKKRYSDDYQRQTQLKCNPTTTIKLQLEFLECYSAFVILLLGGLIALAFAFCERRYQRRKFKKQVELQLHFFYANID